MAYMYVDIDLSDVDDDELIDELKERGHRIIKDDSSDLTMRLEKIYHLRRQGLPYDHLMDAYINDSLGKVV
jgi:hypothetical protein